ncbi:MULTISPECIES: HlyD family secretion protein [unclassified Rhizobium]|uniref:efflux RND transporter periplasmic adaptor subunit n=1 Tax=unclassified Rhizobium TaxID=2613769 RepID=UPI00160A7274|nr:MULTISPECIES: HlyD family secretion protein [unclassified Rhizobium]MBB3541097.1 RND family efflux transporter MFP subunit [Rhizobium sp. BK399]MCS4096142.1 RND family efflux transporter MFP subunit [Rhizobium sp. BK176]
MKSLLAHSGRFLLTGVMVALAGVLGWHLWDYYMDEPWTRDGKIRADVVRLAADVSGIVSEVDAKDNQAVRKGDVIFRIDQARFALALRQAEAQMESSKAALDMARSDLELYRKLGESSVTRQKIQQAETTVQQDEAAYSQAVISRDTAQLNLDRSVVRAPVNGVLTNFSMKPGNYVTAGTAVTALIDSDSYYVAGYFEENKLDRIQVGDAALVYLMGSKTPLKGHVDGVAGGIEDRERSDTSAQLANVTPTFTWVRLAQRVPVRVALDTLPDDTALVAGRTASVTIVN